MAHFELQPQDELFLRRMAEQREPPLTIDADTCERLVSAGFLVRDSGRFALTGAGLRHVRASRKDAAARAA